MSISTTKVSQEFSGNGSLDTFSFSAISFLENTAKDVFDVYIDDVLQDKADWSIAEDAATDGVATGGDLVFTSAPANGTTIEIKRAHDLTQPTAFGASYTKSASKNSADRQLLQIQELDERIGDIEGGSGGGSSSSVATIPDWETATAYIVDQVILYDDQYSKFLYKCLEAHTSGTFATDLNDNKWELVVVVGEKGDTGEKGTKGDTGDTGAQGPQGDAGSDGADGIFSEIASEGEAEAGTNNTKGMSPLRTKQSIENSLADYTDTSTLDAEQDAQDLEITSLKNRTTVLEDNAGMNLYTGRQRLKNNESTPEQILGRDADVAEIGKGDLMQIDASGAEWVKFECIIKRQDDTETRLVQVTLVLHWDGSEWLIGRESTTNLTDGDPDGVTFDIDSVGDVGTVNYVTDDMNGGNYSGSIFYRGYEIINNFEE